MPSLSSKQLNVSNLQEIDKGLVALAINHALATAIGDVIARPGEKAARKVLIEVAIAPGLDKISVLKTITQEQAEAARTATSSLTGGLVRVEADASKLPLADQQFKVRVWASEELEERLKLDLLVMPNLNKRNWLLHVVEDSWLALREEATQRILEKLNEYLKGGDEVEVVRAGFEQAQPQAASLKSPAADLDERPQSPAPGHTVGSANSPAWCRKSGAFPSGRARVLRGRRGGLMAEDHVVVDVEIATPIEELPGGWEATDQVGVAVAVVYEHRGDRFRVYGPGEVQKLQDRLCRARRVTGFNHWDFDLPVIWGAKRSEWRATRSGGDGRWASLREGLAPQCDDLLRRIWESAGLDPETFTDGHQGFGLNAVCEATLGVGKIGHGGDAPRWYREGQVQRVVNYCLDDVTLTRDLAAFIDRYGHIVHPKTLKPLRIVPGPFVALKW